MTTPLRRAIVATLLVLSFVGLAIVAGSAQQAAGAAGQGASAGAPAAAPQATPSPRPEAKALTDAMALTDMSARLAALEKIRTDFPDASNLTAVDQQLLTTLANNFPDRTDALSTVFERFVARVPADATFDARVSGLVTPIGVVVGKKLLLDRAQALLTELAAFDAAKYTEQVRDADKRANRAERPQAQIDTQFKAAKARVLDPLARVYLAKGDQAKAEATYKEVIALQPTFGSAHQALVDMYTAKNDYASAEALIKTAIDASPVPAQAARPRQALADLYIKKGDDAKAEEQLNEILKTNATSTTALVPLARIEAKKGDNAKALDHFMTAALSGTLKAEDEASMESLYAKTNKGNVTLEAALDKAYLEKFPNPVKPEAYTPSAARTKKLVLLELFTGSGCPPCVASDLALDAAMERYSDHVISLVYHEHIPQPDPMVAANNNDRRLYYSVSGVPTFEIDGAMVANASGSNPGGGGRTNTQAVYTNYKASIDKALEVMPKANLNVKATGEGDQVSVTVNVTALPANAKDLRLHIVLAEKELKFTGENGIRFHPMAVRATAGEKGAGLPITATGTTKYTFSLNQIKDEITKSLAAELTKRRSGGNTTATYMAEDHAYTAIDTSELVVVAFIQDGAYRAPKVVPPAPRGTGAAPAAPGVAVPPPQPAGPTASADLELTNVLNAAKTDVVFAPASNKKGGGR